MQPDDSAVGHDSGGHDTGGFRGGEEGEPALHDAVQCVHTWDTHRGMNRCEERYRAEANNNP